MTAPQPNPSSHGPGGVTDHMATIRASVAELQREGIAPFQLPYKSKKAEIPWEQYQTAPPDDGTLERWFGNGRACNVAALCGTVSHGLVVLVFNNFDVYQAAFAGQSISLRTWVIDSKRGPHVYVRVTGRLPETQYYDHPRQAAALEVRAEGAYVVTLGSVHPDGPTYTRRGTNPPNILEVDDFDTWLAPLLRSANQFGWPLVRRGARDKLGQRPEPVGELIPDGARNVELTRLAGAMRRHSSSQREIEAALLVANEERCQSPLGADEVAAIAASVARYPADRRPADNFSTSNDMPKPLEVNFSCDAADLLAEAGDETLPYLPLLGREGYLVEGWSHLLAGYPRVGKTELLVAIVSEWLELGKRVIWFSEEPRTLWKVRLKRRGSWPRGLRLVFGLGREPSELLATMASADETVVLVDTIRNLLRLHDETDNSEIARVLNPWIATARQVGKTPIFVHHDRKGGGEHGEGIAGGHALLGAVDIGLELLRDGHGVANRRRVRAFPRVIQPPELLYERHPDGTMQALGEPDAVALEEVKRRAQSELTDEWRRTDEIHADLEEPRPSKEQLRKALLLLAQDRQAARDPDLSVVRVQGKTVRWRLPTSLPTALPLVGSEVSGQADGHVEVVL